MPLPLTLYDNYTRSLRRFEPLTPGPVGLYTCGPTVYDYQHIGNYRTFLFEDWLKRALQWNGYAVRHVMNVTDVHDKIIANAAKAQKSIEDYTREFTKAFFEDAAGLRLERAEHVAPEPPAVGEALLGHVARADADVVDRADVPAQMVQTRPVRFDEGYHVVIAAVDAVHESNKIARTVR